MLGSNNSLSLWCDRRDRYLKPLAHLYVLVGELKQGLGNPPHTGDLETKKAIDMLKRIIGNKKLEFQRDESDRIGNSVITVGEILMALRRTTPSLYGQLRERVHSQWISRIFRCFQYYGEQYLARNSQLHAYEVKKNRHLSSVIQEETHPFCDLLSELITTDSNYYCDTNMRALALEPMLVYEYCKKNLRGNYPQDIVDLISKYYYYYALENEYYCAILEEEGAYDDFPPYGITQKVHRQFLEKYQKHNKLYVNSQGLDPLLTQLLNKIKNFYYMFTLIQVHSFRDDYVKHHPSNWPVTLFSGLLNSLYPKHSIEINRVIGILKTVKQDYLNPHDELSPDKLSGVCDSFKMYFAANLCKASGKIHSEIQVSKDLAQTYSAYKMKPRSKADQVLCSTMLSLGYAKDLTLMFKDFIWNLVSIHSLYTRIINSVPTYPEQSNVMIPASPKRLDDTMTECNAIMSKWRDTSPAQLVSPVRQGILDAAREYIVFLTFQHRVNKVEEKFREKFCCFPDIKGDFFEIKVVSSKDYVLLKRKKIFCSLPVDDEEKKWLEQNGLAELLDANVGKFKNPGIIVHSKTVKNEKIRSSIQDLIKYGYLTKMELSVKVKSFCKISFVKKNIESLTLVQWTIVINKILLQFLEKMTWQSDGLTIILKNHLLKSYGRFLEAGTPLYGWQNKVKLRIWQPNAIE